MHDVRHTQILSNLARMGLPMQDASGHLAATLTVLDYDFVEVPSSGLLVTVEVQDPDTDQTVTLTALISPTEAASEDSGDDDE